MRVKYNRFILVPTSLNRTTLEKLYVFIIHPDHAQLTLVFSIGTCPFVDTKLETADVIVGGDLEWLLYHSFSLTINVWPVKVNAVDDFAYGAPYFRQF